MTEAGLSYTYELDLHQEFTCSSHLVNGNAPPHPLSLWLFSDQNFKTSVSINWLIKTCLIYTVYFTNGGVVYVWKFLYDMEKILVQCFRNYVVSRNAGWISQEISLQSRQAQAQVNVRDNQLSDGEETSRIMKNQVLHNLWPGHYTQLISIKLDKPLFCFRSVNCNSKKMWAYQRNYY